MDPSTVRLIIGQTFGVLAVILGFVTYQLKTSKAVMYTQSVVALAFIAHYALIGAYSGCALNAVCCVRNFVYAKRDVKALDHPVIPVIFAAIMAALGALSWQGWPSLFVIAGLIINSFGMRFRNPQNIRRTILISSPLVIVYDAIYRSYGGVIYESVAIASSVIGLIRYGRDGKNTGKGTSGT